MIDHEKLQRGIDTFWEESILPTLTKYIEIPNVSSMFDREWEKHGHVDQALDLVKDWLETNAPAGATVEVGKLPKRTPLLFVEIPGPGSKKETVLMYGHLDKQPEMTGWRQGLGAWTPVRDGDRLYGRGGADDGYAAFASIAALRALQEQGVPHSRVVLLVEFSEESGSPDLPAYVERFAAKIGEPNLVICLDSGAGNYEQLWSTTSLRGLVGGTLRVDVLGEGVHSGEASGIVPSSFRIARALLSRLEDETTGAILPEALHVEIPEQRVEQTRKMTEVLGEEVYSKFPWMPGMKPVATDPTELALNRTWRPALAITGQEGMPPIESAGNVLRPYTTLNLSLRLPPTLDPRKAETLVREILTSDPPYGAKVTLELGEPAPGWNAPALAPWLDAALEEASKLAFGKPAMHMGEGGSIPFMGMLGEKFPEAQFVITGVLGPESNAHGPNEFLDVAYAKKLTAATAHVLARHYRRE